MNTIRRLLDRLELATEGKQLDIEILRFSDVPLPEPVIHAWGRVTFIRAKETRDETDPETCEA